MTNKEIKVALLTLARSIMDNVTRDVGPRVNANELTMTSKFSDFMRMNPPVSRF